MHLHIPDGVLPPQVWGPALVVALALLAWSARARSGETRRELAYQGALGALVLAAMALEVPLGPLEYHLTLLGPLGVLLGPAASFQVLFVVNAILAMLGHGGFTVVGLNALVLGAGSALARPLYSVFARRLAPGAALGASTALVQVVSGALWLAVVATALRGDFGIPGTPPPAGRLGLVAGLTFPMWLVGIAAESLVAIGIGRFLARVRPDLLPGGRPTIDGAAGSEAA
ncbi:MAG TPA: energy-coupling factor ABC transporter permease [Candidatus Eisenbacteria bacterium]